MGNWTPITPDEPKEWVDVLLWVPETDHSTGVPMTGFRSSGDPGKFRPYRTLQMLDKFDVDETILPTPTHWMPVLEGPK